MKDLVNKLQKQKMSYHSCLQRFLPTLSTDGATCQVWHSQRTSSARSGFQPRSSLISDTSSNTYRSRSYPKKSDEDCNNPLQVDFAVDAKSESSGVAVSQAKVTTVSASTASSPLNISHIELNDAGILLGSGDVIQSSLDASANPIQLEATSHLQGLPIADESDSCDVSAKFIDGQAVQLEDGSTAFIHTIPREGLQPVQLEDGTLAYLSQSREELFNGEASGLELDHLSSPQMQTESTDDKEAGAKAAVRETQSKGSQTRSGSASEKAFACPYEGCNRVYTTPHHLKVHERSHTGDRPFKCTVPKCGKAFATGYGLKSHTRVHTGETPYRCAEASCGKAFKTSGDLQKHLRTHTGERPFKCPYPDCDRAFTTSNIRKVHIRTHTGEKPYVCESCGRAFASATNFKNHIRIHTGEKPYSCNFQGCNKRFTEYSSLYKHHIVHTRDKPYVCNLCGKNYRQTSTLAMHERTAHKNAPATKSVATSVNEENLGMKIETSPEENRLQCLELVAAELASPTNQNTVIENANSSQENIGVSAVPKKLPAVITLQGGTGQLLQEHSQVYAIQLQTDGVIDSSQQIILVADSAQLASLQQLTQVHLQNIVQTTVVADSSTNTAGKTE